MDELLEKIKRRLGIKDNMQDDLIADIISDTVSEFKAITRTTTVPEPLHFIIVDVSVKRFNKLGSEGTTTHTVEGESLSFENNGSDFLPYRALLSDYFDLDQTRKGRMMWN